MNAAQHANILPIALARPKRTFRFTIFISPITVLISELYLQSSSDFECFLLGLEIHFHPKAGDHRRAYFRSRIRGRAKSFPRRTDDLDVRSDVQPRQDLDVVIKLSPLLVIQAQLVAKGRVNVTTEFEIIVADAKLVFVPRRDDSSAKTNTVKLLKGIGFRIG